MNARDLYLDLLKRSLMGLIYEDAAQLVLRMQGRRPVGITRGQAIVDRDARIEGRDWPLRAHTMIGARRLDHLQRCVQDLLAEGVPGDLIEAGVWRGGATILMRAVLKAHGVTDRTVWVADSFAGLPVPDVERFPVDRGWLLNAGELAVSAEEVRGNFERYGLLDDHVRFLEGWFRDTLPAAPIGRLALIRFDGDLYESATDALEALYPRLSPGGYVIIDDYVLESCRRGVDDFRRRQGITEAMSWIDWNAAYWRRAPRAAAVEAPAAVAAVSV